MSNPLESCLKILRIVGSAYFARHFDETLMAFGVCTFLIRICFAGHVPNISENHDERKAAENQCICCPFSIRISSDQ